MNHPDIISHGRNRADRLFDSEEGSDVTFLVGTEAETWRFPGHRSILSKANPVFKAMLAGPEHCITIPDVDSRAFDLLLRYLYNEDAHLQSVSTALCTFYAAQKYMCTGLMTECILFLDQNLDTSNVLHVYQEMRLHSGQRVAGDPWAPSAPPYHQVCNNKDPNDNFDSTLSLCSSLVHNCLLYIDKHADRVLAEESIEDLSAECLKELAERDTLYISSENMVYFALERWSNRECKRRQLEMSHESRRAVLGDDLLFCVRFLLMSQKEFFTGAMAGDLLGEQEGKALMGRVLGIPVINSVPSLTDEVLNRLRTPRRPPTAQSFPIGHNNRHYLPAHLHEPFRLKPNKQKKQRRKDGSPKRKCTGSCVTDCVLRALSCLFD